MEVAKVVVLEKSRNSIVCDFGVFIFMGKTFLMLRVMQTSWIRMCSNFFFFYKI